MDAITVLKTRRSVRSFESTPISREIIEDIIDCARMAPTARGEQPWEFIAVTDRRTLARIAHITDHGAFIGDSPACVAVFCADTTYFLEDGSAATENILLAAWAHGIGSCWVAGDKKPYAEAVRRVTGAPDGYRLISLIAIGHAANVPSPGKRALSDVLHWERF